MMEAFFTTGTEGGYGFSCIIEGKNLKKCLSNFLKVYDYEMNSGLGNIEELDCCTHLHVEAVHVEDGKLVVEHLHKETDSMIELAKLKKKKKKKKEDKKKRKAKFLELKKEFGE